ncbi:alpha/beta hydrolase [Cumulibacter soli]|uniref:alpha/beta hydrolase n=1 Tax=Cumulibacter soli TaxID=2546344 RepID=UPI0010674DD6|nr:alpha/beta hydrolase [Cumulibacter soli]
MDFALRSLVEPVSATAKTATGDFYRSRPRGFAVSGYDELLKVRAQRHYQFGGNDRAVVASVAASDRGVPVRIIEPRERPAVGVLLHFPGGGFYLSSAAADDERNARRADATGLTIVSVNYRLAPENPWPAAPDDCVAVAEWLVNCATDRFGTDRLLIGGFSAGATLAAATALRLRHIGIVEAFSGTLLEAGTYDMSAHAPSGHTVLDDYFVEAYVGHVADRCNPDISPAYGDLRGLPPTLLVVGSDDVVLPDSLLMAARLSAASNDVDLRIYPGVPHGFSNHPTPIGRRALADIDTWLLDALAHA